jgi:predicted O-methyltransferase YrrM
MTFRSAGETLVAMSIGGTTAYHDLTGLPQRVAAAVRAASTAGFEFSCRPAQGRLLSVLAAGVTAGVIGETGTGCGVGLAWLTEAAGPGTRLVSVERDPVRSTISADLFADDPRVTVIPGDWTQLAGHAPFDLLVLDGGGSGKTDEPIDPGDWLTVGGTVVIDDFAPITDWPPLHDGAQDEARKYWLTHPDLLATEIRLGPDLATVVARYVPSQSLG